MAVITAWMLLLVSLEVDSAGSRCCGLERILFDCAAYDIRLGQSEYKPHISYIQSVFIVHEKGGVIFFLFSAYVCRIICRTLIPGNLSNSKLKCRLFFLLSASRSVSLFLSGFVLHGFLNYLSGYRLHSSLRILCSERSNPEEEHTYNPMRALLVTSPRSSIDRATSWFKLNDGSSPLPRMPLELSTRSHIFSFRSLTSKGFPSGYSKSVCVHLHSENSKPTILISQTTPDEHPLTPPPCRWAALNTLPALAKFQLVWRRLRDVVPFRSSCLFEHILIAVCALPEYQSVV